MNEGDPKVMGWQVWEDWSPEPEMPDGMMPAGPWYPFAAVSVARGEECVLFSAVVYRRPLVRAEAEKWIPLRDLRYGAVFETKDGAQAMLSAMAGRDGDLLCFPLKLGGPSSLPPETLVRALRGV